MPRFKLTLEYTGTRYSGWQRQQNARTVEGELQRAVREGLGVPRFETYGSGRTDAGVHALRQVAHLDLPSMLAPDAIVVRLNAALPHDINVLTPSAYPRGFTAPQRRAEATSTKSAGGAPRSASRSSGGSAIRST
jgi:tRNA pseudouridine38-40 synthase